MSEIKVKIIGNGSAFNPDLTNTSFLIKTPIGNLWLIDCGYNVYGKLKKLNVIDKIEQIFITHLHQDHIGSLEILAYHKEFISKNKLEILDLYYDGKQISLLLCLNEKYENGSFKQMDYIKFNYPLTNIYTNIQSLVFFKDELRVYTLKHYQHKVCVSHSFIFDDYNSDKTIIITGDTDINEEIFSICQSYLSLGRKVICFHDSCNIDNEIHANKSEIDHLFNILEKNNKFKLFHVHNDDPSIIDLEV